MVRVTRDDITKGHPHTVTLCPVARAVIKAVRNSQVVVGEHVIHVNGDRHLTPRAVKTFIRKFDAGLPVKPFQFRLDIGAEETA